MVGVDRTVNVRMNTYPKPIIIGLLALNAGLIGAHLFYDSPRDKKSSDASARPSHQVSSTSSGRLGKLDVPELEKIKTTEPKSLAAWVARLDDYGLSDFSVPLSEWLQKDPEAASAWVDGLARELAGQGKHDRALFLLGYLNSYGTVRNSERRVVHMWTENGPEKMTGHFKTMAANQSIDYHLVSAATAVMLNERSKHSDAFFSTIAGLKGPEYHELQGALLEKLLVHANEEQMPKVLDLIEKNISNPKAALNAPTVASMLSIDQPEKALDWIARLPIADQVVHAEAFSNVFKEISLSNPDLASKIISGETFLDRYYGAKARDKDGALTPGAKKFFDTAVESFIASTMRYHPEVAVEASASFFDESLKATYKKQAQDLVGLPPLEPTEGHHNCAHCAKKAAQASGEKTESQP